MTTQQIYKELERMYINVDWTNKDSIRRYNEKAKEYRTILEIKMDTKRKMEQFVKEHYPNAVFDYYIESRWGIEYQFRACEETDETWCCVLQNGEMTILYDF